MSDSLTARDLWPLLAALAVACAEPGNGGGKGGAPSDGGTAATDGGVGDGSAVYVDKAATWTWSSSESCRTQDATRVVAGFQGNTPTGWLALDTDHIYLAVADDSSCDILSIPLPCGRPEVLAACLSGQPGLDGILAGPVFSDGQLFWGDSNAVWALSVTTKAVQRLATVDAAGGTPGLYSIAARGGYVYWAGLDGAVSKVSASGGEISVLASGYEAPGDIAVNDSAVYWASRASGNVGPSRILKVPLGGGTVTTIVEAQQGLAGIALTSTGLYWGNLGTFGDSEPGGPGAIFMEPLSGAAPTVFAPEETNPSSVLASDSMLYWMDGAPPLPESVRARSLVAGDVETVVPAGHVDPLPPNPKNPARAGLVASSDSLYFAEWSNDYGPPQTLPQQLLRIYSKRLK